MSAVLERLRQIASRGRLSSAPVDSVLPVVSGVTDVGFLLSVSNGACERSGPTTDSYQWFKASLDGNGSAVLDGNGRPVGTAISGETGSSYLLREEDAGERIFCEVTATSAPHLRTANRSDAVGPITVGYSVAFHHSDSNGVEHYKMRSCLNKPRPSKALAMRVLRPSSALVLRVLRPTRPAAGQAHRFVYLCPVTSGVSSAWGDPLGEVLAGDFHNTYNATIIVPFFWYSPWLGNHPKKRYFNYESFMVRHLRAWTLANFATSGTEKHLHASFSKCGFGLLGLIMRNPTLVDKVAVFDTVDATSMGPGGERPGGFTDWGADVIYNDLAYCNRNYDYQANAVAWSAPFKSASRIQIDNRGPDFVVAGARAHAAFRDAGIVHNFIPGNQDGRYLGHTWGGGWLGDAFAYLCS